MEGILYLSTPDPTPHQLTQLALPARTAPATDQLPPAPDEPGSSEQSVPSPTRPMQIIPPVRPKQMPSFENSDRPKPYLQYWESTPPTPVRVGLQPKHSSPSMQIGAEFEGLAHTDQTDVFVVDTTLCQPLLADLQPFEAVEME